jgi:hypothetical protein
MGPTPFQLETLWSWVLRDLPTRKASFFLVSLIAPVVFWLFGAALAGFGAVVTKLGILGLGFLAFLALSSALLQAIWKSRSPLQRGLTGATVLVHQAYYSASILMISASILIFVLELTRTSESHLRGLITALYATSVIAGGVWAPHSFPKGPEDLRLAAEREWKWLPWTIALPGTFATLCALLSALVSRDGIESDFFALTFGSLVAMLLAWLGVLALYRFVVLVVSFAQGLDPLRAELDRRQE